VVTVGRGDKALFWHSSWLDGQAPIDIAPNLYTLAWRKNQTVKDDLCNHNWTRGLWRMETVQQMGEFVKLWDLVTAQQLNDQDDQILWRWTAHGTYTTKSAYLAQFSGSYSDIMAETIWKAHAEGKLKFFAWLLVQAKILTADKLALRHWPCNPICSLCDQEAETAAHICIQCPFAKEVWMLVKNWVGEHIVHIDEDVQTLKTWWERSLQGRSAAQQKTTAAILMYSAWNIWKERNRRTFEGTTRTPAQVLGLIKEELGLFSTATGKLELPP
jgi:hypothetical protein